MIECLMIDGPARGRRLGMDYPQQRLSFAVPPDLQVTPALHKAQLVWEGLRMRQHEYRLKGIVDGVACYEFVETLVR